MQLSMARQHKATPEQHKKTGGSQGLEPCVLNELTSNCTGNELLPQTQNKMITGINNQNPSFSMMSEFLDMSKSADNIFQDISLKKIKKKAVDRVEKEVIGYVLDKTAWNRSKASKVLKISYKTLLYKISELGLEPPQKNL